MNEAEIRLRVAEARVARIATIDEEGRAHLVPIVFALDGDRFYSTSDAGSPAKRVRNVERDPRVTVLIDSYDEDWSTVWWVRLRGDGRIVSDEQEEDHARRLLWGKYPQFGSAPPEEGSGAVMAVDVTDWSGWAYTEE